MKLAVIPARGGSKRIPRKNLKDFCGRPIMAWSIAAARESGCFDRIIVSTDDAEIASVARAHGAETPFVRPEELSNDHAATVPVIRHAVQWQAENGAAPEYACCIYATAPFVRAQDLRRGLETLREQDSRYAFSVTGYGYPVQRALRLTPEGRLAMLQPEHLNTRSQDLLEVFHDAGQFYWGQADAWLHGEGILGEGAAPVTLPRYRVQDIDTEEDWRRAELMFHALAQTEGTAT
jgi:N-acylneuraminate cytidylyltransferase